eukprot:403362645
MMKNQLGLEFSQMLFTASLGQNLQNLTSLNLSENPIHDQGAILIYQCMNYTPNLTDLNMSQCNLTIQSFEPFLKCLELLTHLKNTDLSRNDFSESSYSQNLQQFFRFLQTSTFSLNLSDCKLNEYSSNTISLFIEGNTRMKQLILQNNKELGESGLWIIIMSMFQNDVLKELDLRQSISIELLQQYQGLDDKRITVDKI